MEIPRARKKTRRIHVGAVPIGDGAPIAVQSMTNTPSTDVDATVGQIEMLARAGCEIIRVAIPDDASAETFKHIVRRSPIPVIADIHFDYRLALSAIESGAHGVRVNPGNIGGYDKFEIVLRAAADAGVCVRVGVNSGSLEKDLLKRYGAPTPQAMVESALRFVEFMAGHDFTNYKVALKSSDVINTVTAYRLFSEVSDAPLHVGVTEAGSLVQGSIKSAIGIGMVLADGIGDTLRVSLSAHPVYEVRAAYAILRTLRLRERGIEVVSCPTCARCQVNLLPVVEEVENRLAFIEKPLKVAIMGCVVNGPGEAREADIGVAGGKGKAILFKKGELVRKIDEKEMADVLVREVVAMTGEEEIRPPENS